MTGWGALWQALDRRRISGIRTARYAGTSDLPERWPGNAHRRLTRRDRQVLTAWAQHLWQDPADAECDETAPPDGPGETILPAVALLLDPLQGRPVPQLGIAADELPAIALQRRAATQARHQRRVRRYQAALAAVGCIAIAALSCRPVPGVGLLLGLVPPPRISVRARGARTGDGTGWWVS
jgi:hypothetical protein